MGIKTYAIWIALLIVGTLMIGVIYVTNNVSGGYWTCDAEETVDYTCRCYFDEYLYSFPKEYKISSDLSDTICDVRNKTYVINWITGEHKTERVTTNWKCKPNKVCVIEKFVRNV